MKRMNLKRNAIVMLGVVVFTVLMSSCHRNTCPTFGKEEVKELREERC